MIEGFSRPPIAPEKLSAESKMDSVIITGLRYVLHGWPEVKDDGDMRIFSGRRSELSIHKGCLLWGNWRVVIPATLRQEVMTLLHANHPGITVMKACARSHVWWPGMDAEIENCVKRCQRCHGTTA